MFAIACVPVASPNAMRHVSPAACWAVVGGQGYLAASVAASPPVESVPVAGGPTVPVVTVNAVGPKLPLALVATTVGPGLPPGRGFGPQDTGAGCPRSAIVGWDGSLLHSRMAPAELAAK